MVNAARTSAVVAPHELRPASGSTGACRGRRADTVPARVPSRVLRRRSRRCHHGRVARPRQDRAQAWPREVFSHAPSENTATKLPNGLVVVALVERAEEVALERTGPGPRKPRRGTLAGAFDDAAGRRHPVASMSRRSSPPRITSRQDLRRTSGTRRLRRSGCAAILAGVEEARPAPSRAAAGEAMLRSSGTSRHVVAYAQEPDWRAGDDVGRRRALASERMSVDLRLLLLAAAHGRAVADCRPRFARRRS